MQMADFSYENHVPFALDFASLPTISPFDLPSPSMQLQGPGLATTSSCFPCYYNPFDDVDDIFPAEMSTVNAAASSISAYTTTVSTTATPTSTLDSGRTVPSLDNKTTSSSSAQVGEVASKTRYSLQKKRKLGRQGCNSGPADAKEAKEAKRRKPIRKGSGAMKEAQMQPPTGFIHVRARRGEATDSHSLAERVRRERIRQRMKTLQALIPGCDKVVGKALLLDEIINYVQSLQNQVEFLSSKLASMDPMPYGFGLDFDDYTLFQLEKLENMSTGLSNVQQLGHIQPTAFADTTNSHPVHDSSVPVLLHGEGPTSSSQDNGSNFIMQVGDHRQSPLIHVEFNNISSFH